MKETTIPLHNFTSDDAYSIPFHLTPFGKGEDGQGYNIHEPHRHNFFEILFFIKAEGKHVLDDKEFPINNNSIHFVSPGQVHQLYNRNTKGYVLTFSRDFFYKNSIQNKNKLFEHPLFFGNTDSAIVDSIDEKDFSQFTKILELALYEFKDSNPDESILLNYVQILIHKSNKFITNSKPVNSQVREFNILLEEQFYKWHKVNDYAEALHISPVKLSKIISENTGKSATDHINERVLIEAKRLLGYSSLSAKEIAYQIGFSDPAHFSKFFKRFTSKTPNQYGESKKEIV